MTCQELGFEVKRRALAFVLFFALANLPALAQSVMLGWEPSPDPNAVGYNIYYGTASHNYTSKVSVGNVTNTTLNGLTGGNTYFFAATTYDAANQESGFSNEASYGVPTTTTNATPTQRSTKLSRRRCGVKSATESRARSQTNPSPARASSIHG